MQNVTYTTSNPGSDAAFGSSIALGSTYLMIAMIVSVVLLVLAHVIMAQGVANDVKRLQQKGRTVHYFGPTGWAFVVLFLGVVGLAVHWMMHHSSFRAVESTTPER